MPFSLSPIGGLQQYCAIVSHRHLGVCYEYVNASKSRRALFSHQSFSVHFLWRQEITLHKREINKMKLRKYFTGCDLLSVTRTLIICFSNILCNNEPNESGQKSEGIVYLFKMWYKTHRGMCGWNILVHSWANAIINFMFIINWWWFFTIFVM